MKYIILEKAKPYIRTRRGKLEHVKGYAGKPKGVEKEPEKKIYEDVGETIERIKEKYKLDEIKGLEFTQTEKGTNVKVVDASDVNSENLQKNLLIFDKELSKWKDKCDFSGRGVLQVAMGEFDTQDTVRGFYQNSMIACDSKFTSSIPHEFGHYVFEYDFNILGSGGVITGETSPKGDYYKVITSETVKKGFEDYFEDMEGRLKQSRLQSRNVHKSVGHVLELFKKLEKVYSSKKFMDDFNKLNEQYHPDGKGTASQIDYTFRPTEIFARAFEFYISGEGLLLNNVEAKNKDYIKAVTEWGDKYIKTRIIKSLETNMRYIILEKAVRVKPFTRTVKGKVERVGEYSRAGDPRKKEIPKGKEGKQKEKPKEEGLNRWVQKRKVGETFDHEGRHYKVTATGKDGVTARDSDGKAMRLFHEDVGRYSDEAKAKKEKEEKGWKELEEGEAKSGKVIRGHVKSGKEGGELPKQFHDYADFMEYSGKSGDWNLGKPEVMEYEGKTGIDIPMINSKDGKRFGHFEVHFSNDGQVAEMRSLFLSKDWQGKGVGSEIIHRGIEYAKQKGFKTATMTANGSVGVYAWGIQGFDWKDEKESTELKDEFAKFLQKKHGETADTNKFKHIWDIATYKVGDERVGKKFLLGAGHNLWFHSELNLADENSMSWKIYSKYLEKKGGGAVAKSMKYIILPSEANLKLGAEKHPRTDWKMASVLGKISEEEKKANKRRGKDSRGGVSFQHYEEIRSS